MTTTEEGDVPRLGRAPWVSGAAMSPVQQAFAQTVRQQWGGGAVGLEPIDSQGRLLGPFDLMAASPEVGAKILALAGSFRDAALTPAERELVIVLVAAERESTFMWHGHVSLLAAAGVGADVVDSIDAHQRPQLASDLEAIYDVTWALLHQRDLDDEQFRAAEEELGWRRVQEVVWLVGLYETFALAMRVARVPTPGVES